jgi:hypothetical protein
MPFNRRVTGPLPDPQALTGERMLNLHLFAGFYALFNGVTFITTVGVLFAQAMQRFLHRFHLEIAVHDEPDKDS